MAAASGSGAPAPPLSWPAWLEAARVDDGLAASAYETTPPDFRAALKTGLALAHFHFGECTPCLDDTARHDRLGFLRVRSRVPAPWTLIVISPAYAAAARLTAACAAALLAGVPRVGAVCLGGDPHAAALVSLELSGVEDVFRLDAGRFAALLDGLAALPGPRGRVVVLHDGELASIAPAARKRDIPCHEEHHPPRLRVEATAPIDRELLAFAHGTAAVDAAPTAAAPVDAVFRATAEADPDAALTLCPGCEGFWLHPGLDPNFFTVSRQAFAPWAPLRAETAAAS